MVKYVDEKFVELPANPSEGEALVFDGEKWVAQEAAPADSRPYKVYTALLTQSGTDAPVATVLENTLGGEVVWSYINTGIYSLTSSNLFTLDKTYLHIGPTSGGEGQSFIALDPPSIYIYTYENNVPENSKLENTSIEIRVYND